MRRAALTELRPSRLNRRQPAIEQVRHADPLRPEGAIIRLRPGNPSSAAFPHVVPGVGYLESSAHYAAVARRALAVMRDGDGSMVLLISDPPADSQALTEALGKIAGSIYVAITVPCGPELTLEELEHKFLLKQLSGVGAVGERPGSSSLPLPLFVFNDFDRLSDQQVEEICQLGLGQDRRHSAAILLTSPDFAVRIQRPPLRFLEERITAKLRFQEVSDDETVTFLHDQLLTRRNRKAEARGFRHGIMIGLAAAVVATAANLAFYLLYPTARQVGDASASSAENISNNHGQSLLQPDRPAQASGAAEPAALNGEIAAAIATAPVLSPPPQITAKNPVHSAPTSGMRPPAARQLDVAETDALLARGDSFFSAGDITSARPFYARAAEAGSGRAAMQLGATFDPALRSPSALSGATADAGQALFWYQRASELGVAEAEQRIKDLAGRPPK